MSIYEIQGMFRIFNKTFKTIKEGPSRVSNKKMLIITQIYFLVCHKYSTHFSSYWFHIFKVLNIFFTK